MPEPSLTLSEMLLRVQRAAVRDHTNRDRLNVMRADIADFHAHGCAGIAPRTWIQECHEQFDNGTLPVELVQVNGIREEPSSLYKWSIEVTYSKYGYRAIYGVRNDNSLQLWAD